jgi:hypothetical protein
MLLSLSCRPPASARKDDLGAQTVLGGGEVATQAEEQDRRGARSAPSAPNALVDGRLRAILIEWAATSS